MEENSANISEHILNLTVKSEKQRLLSSKILLDLFINDVYDDEIIPQLSVCIHERITKSSEESEDVLENILEIISLVIFRHSKILNLDHLLEIQIAFLSNKAPQILESSCKCVKLFCEVQRDAVNGKLEVLCSHLSRVSFNKRFRVRIAAVSALGKAFSFSVIKLVKYY